MTKKKKWAVNASVVGSKHLGVFMANTKEEAIELAEKEAGCFLCHQCESECQDAEIDKIYAEEIK